MSTSTAQQQGLRQENGMYLLSPACNSIVQPPPGFVQAWLLNRVQPLSSCHRMVFPASQACTTTHLRLLGRLDSASNVRAHCSGYSNLGCFGVPFQLCGCCLPVLLWKWQQQCPRKPSMLRRRSSEWVLQWARQQDTTCIWNANTTAHAMNQGHLTVNQWARRHGCSCRRTYHTEAEQQLVSITISSMIF